MKFLVKLPSILSRIKFRATRDTRLTNTLPVITLPSDIGGRVPGRGAAADKDHEERDGCLSLYRQQWRATGGQQTYFYERSL